MASEIGTICWHMPKSRRESQSLYQQPIKLEWGTPPWATDYEVVDRAILSQLAEERFVRQVQEEVLVRRKEPLPRILACPFRVFPGVCLRPPEKRKQMNGLPAKHGILDAGLASVPEIALLNV